MNDMSTIELKERLELSFYGLAQASVVLNEVEDTADPEIIEYREALTSFMHHARRLVDKVSKRPHLNAVPGGCQVGTASIHANQGNPHANR